ncbi:uncharacterized protein KZ484_026607 isoform 1-T1 [Pholidichthys leucotaenia]
MLTANRNSTGSVRKQEPEMDGRPRTPENPVILQRAVTPVTAKTPAFNDFTIQHVLESGLSLHQQLWKKENNSSLDPEEPEPFLIKVEQEEPEPLNIKQEEPELLQLKEENDEPEERIKEKWEEFFTSQEIEQFIQKQETDTFMVTPIYVENCSEQLLCVHSAVSENQDEEGSQCVDSGSTEIDELKAKKRLLETESEHEGAHVVCV